MQIREAARLDEPRLRQLLSKFTDRPERLFGMTDAAAYRVLPRRASVVDAFRAARHASIVWNYTRRSVPHPRAIFDIGCNDGSIVRALGERTGAERTAGVDVVPASAVVPGVEYFRGVEHVPTALSGQFDLCAASMSLHHINDAEGAVALAARLLRAGGVFYVREHDVEAPVDSLLVDIEHRAYDAANSDPGSYGMAHYWSSAQLDAMVTAGGRFVRFFRGPAHGPTRWVVTLYRRTNAHGPAAVRGGGAWRHHMHCNH